jgi:hypothetical protein
VPFWQTASLMGSHSMPQTLTFWTCFNTQKPVPVLVTVSSSPTFGTRWCPLHLAKLVYNSNFTMVFVGDISYIYSFHGIINQLITWASHRSPGLGDCD